MTIVGLFVVTILLILSWILNLSIWRMILFVGGAGDSFSTPGSLSFKMFLVTSSYIFVAPITLVVTWIAFLGSNIEVIQVALMVSIVHIIAFFTFGILFFIKVRREAKEYNKRQRIS